ncbi:hypothetical protein T11_3287 [Trichinella zimbabwensis]|uniref:Uncharacterized protein n=1 Tax=Trichinella zimbabwensis TaxID=268475 RepID=A0A0V1H6T4_9BILA|nr:hypothetical protein T11_3287 [Trichinella zimbabwensis]
MTDRTTTQCRCSPALIFFLVTAGCPTKREVRPELSLGDVIPQLASWPPSSRRPSDPHLCRGWGVGTRWMMFPLPGGPTSERPVSFLWLLNGFPGMIPLHPVRVYHQ